jgi:DNA-binding CsgD family transcriptional regulator
MYEAALEPALWPLVVHRFGDVFGGSAALVVNDPISGVSSLAEAVNFEPGFLASYVAHYGRASPWVKKFLTLPVGALLHRDLAPEIELESTEYYNDWLKPQGLKDALGGVLGKAGNSLSYIIVLRSEYLGAFSGRHHADFQLANTNLQRALAIHARLARNNAHERALFEALDRAGLAAFLLRHDRRLIAHNAPAEHLLTEGLALRSVRNILQPRDPAADTALTHAVAQACRLNLGQAISLSHPASDRPPLSALVVPVPNPSVPFALLEAAGGFALVLVRDPNRTPGPDIHILRSLFGLTAAEARLLAALASGKALDNIAAERGVSYATLRAQLRAVMAKTGTRRQGELVALTSRHPGWHERS